MQKFLVGGAVRDQLLSLPVHERDWVVVGSSPEQLLQQGFRQVGKDFPVFLHPTSNEEYALARTERKSGRGHCGFEVFSSPDVTLEQDLQRRDLTINAIAEDAQGKLIDPCGGQRDLQQRILRHISPAFTEDPLRVLRVARFAARFWSLGFTIAPDTFALMVSISNSGELEQLSKQRIWRETQRALTTDHPEIYLLVLLHTQALACIAPELAAALENKSTLLGIAELRKISDQAQRYVCLVLLASQSNNDFSLHSAEQINTAFAAPGELQECALLLVKYFTQCCAALTLSGEDIYTVLHALDAFRREARCLRLFESMLSAQILFDHYTADALHFLIQLLPTLNSVALSDDEKNTLQGKQIGAAIKQQRITLIETALSNTK